MAADTVLEWNEVAVEATRVARLSPNAQTRALAMVHGAVFDAVNGIERDYAPYLVQRHAPRWASEEAAAAAAAHGVLVGLMPAQQATLDAALASSLAAVPDGRAEDAGVAFGKLVADRMLAERADDGSTDVVTYVPGTGPDDWQPTPPAFAPAALPQWATVEPFGISSPDQFRADPPPSLDSPEFTQAFDQMKAIGAANSTTRTAEQTEIARFWAGPSGTVQPPGHWNNIARGVADAQDNSLAQNARMFALLNVGMADALIAAWDSKFEYNFVRPVTAIRNADNDGNPDTAADPAWSPLLGTPPHPSYIAAHSTVSAAAATVLAEFFGNDAIAFTSSAEIAAGGPVITRSFDGFWDAAREAGASRIYGGIHWSFDNEAGLEAGRSVGQFVADILLRPRGDTGLDGEYPSGVAAPQMALSSALPSRSDADLFFSDAADDDLLD
jgi:membrane-associated phospholipid phosphatase